MRKKVSLMGRQNDGSGLSKQIAGLDGLRGIAILCVTGYHLAPHVLPGGFLGVNLFFVLSGYLMAVTSRRDQAHSGFRAGGFYWKRIARIYPALLLTVCAVLLLAQFLAPDTLRGVRREALSIFIGGNNWWQISRNASYFTRIAGTSPFTHLWSLAIEMQFYLLWPFLFYGYTALSRRGKWGPALFVPLILASVLTMLLLFRPEEDPSRVYYGTDTRLFALLTGGLLGLVQKRPRCRRKAGGWLAAGCILLPAGFAWLCFTADGQSAATYRLFLVLSVLAASGLTALCADRSLSFGRLLDFPPLAWLGKHSYELYLVHYPVIFFVRRRPPAGSVAWNTLTAIALILIGALWLRQVTALLKNSRGRRAYAETTLQNMGGGIPAAGGGRRGGRDVRAADGACQSVGRGSAAARTGASGKYSASGAAGRFR